MTFDGAHGDEQSTGDLGIGEVLTQGGQYLGFPGRYPRTRAGSMGHFWHCAPGLGRTEVPDTRGGENRSRESGGFGPQQGVGVCRQVSDVDTAGPENLGGSAVVVGQQPEQQMSTGDGTGTQRRRLPHRCG